MKSFYTLKLSSHKDATIDKKEIEKDEYSKYGKGNYEFSK